MFAKAFREIVETQIIASVLRARSAARYLRFKLFSKRCSRKLSLIGTVAALVMALAGNAIAEQARGPVTNLPMPRYVSLKASKANVRRGPSLTHRIDWVFKRKGMPLEITAEYGHWRRVRDIDGAAGWVHYSLLSGVRTVIVERDMMPLAMRPEPDTPMIAQLELGVVARLGECGPSWCRLNAAGYKGWARKEDIWGVKAEELRD